MFYVINTSQERSNKLATTQIQFVALGNILFIFSLTFFLALVHMSKHHNNLKHITEILNFSRHTFTSSKLVLVGSQELNHLS